mmetsp:Transcript_21335/g.52222  ORF Transcript_21335/g.52222 Transcript_21335/m.52222 type:complete len:1003 (+) Transcript_21335:418-3426(+)
MTDWIAWASKALDDLDSGMATKIKEVKAKVESSKQCQVLISTADGTQHWVNAAECKLTPDGTYTVTIADDSETQKLGVAKQVQESVSKSSIRTHKVPEVSNSATAAPPETEEQPEDGVAAPKEPSSSIGRSGVSGQGDDSDVEGKTVPANSNDTEASLVDESGTADALKSKDATSDTPSTVTDANTAEKQLSVTEGPGKLDEAHGEDPDEAHGGEDPEEEEEEDTSLQRETTTTPKTREEKSDKAGESGKREKETEGQNDATSSSANVAMATTRESDGTQDPRQTKIEDAPRQSEVQAPGIESKKSAGKGAAVEMMPEKTEEEERKGSADLTEEENENTKQPDDPIVAASSSPAPALAADAAAAQPEKTSTIQETKTEQPEIHWGVACDMLGQNPIRGVRWKKKNEDYDLCQAAYDTLPMEEKQKFIPIFKSELPPPPTSHTPRTGSLDFSELTGRLAKAAGKGLELVKKGVPMSRKKRSEGEHVGSAAPNPVLEERVGSLEAKLKSEADKVAQGQRRIAGLEVELSEKQNENHSLRQVWNETRASLQRAQRSLRASEERFRARLYEREQQSQKKLEVREHEMQETILSLRKQLDSLREDHDKDVTVREKSIAVFEQDKVDMERRLTMTIAETHELRQTIADLEEKNEEMLRVRDQATRDHAKTLHSLRQEHERLQAKLEGERRKKGTELSELKNREGHLEDSNLEIANALAEAQRQLDEKTREVERVKLEAQWIKADRKALEEQLATSKERLELGEQSLAKYQKEAKRNVLSLEKQLEETSSRAASLAEQLNAKILEVKRLQQRMATSPTKRRPSGSVELENGTPRSGPLDGAEEDDEDSLRGRLKTMASHLLKKQNEVDRITAHRNALALQLEAEQRAVKNLEKKIRNIRNNPDTEYYRDRKGKDVSISVNSTAKNGNISSSYANASPAVQRAMRFLDSFSTFVSITLRRNPAARLFFGVYVLMIHLWVLFVLFHFTGHESEYHVERVLPPGSGGSAPGI